MSITTGDYVSCLSRNYFIFLNEFSTAVLGGRIEGLFITDRVSAGMESLAEEVVL